jgi:hypothetical protein
MKLNLSLLTTGAALLAATGAMANPTLGQAGSFGNSSISFVAINDAADTSLTVDLTAAVASFLSTSTGLVTSNGALSAGGATATWNFATNAYSVNGVAQTGNFSWTGATNSFLGTAAGAYRWGVIGGDAVQGNLSASNVIFGQNIIYTGVSNDFDNSNDSGINNGAIANAAGNYNQFLAATSNTGTHTTTVRGANVATAGTAFLGTALAASGQGDFSQQFGTNSFLVAPTAVSKFYLSNQGGAAPRTFAIGAPTTLGTEAAFAGTWTWDESTTTLSYNVAAIPEPGTYAMLIGGLAAVGFMARRRRSA